MKALIFSDSHARIGALQKAWEMHKDSTDAVFFLGDGAQDYDFLRKQDCVPFYPVKGNNDFFCTDPSSRIVTFDHKRIFLTHGHLFYVKSTMAHLVRRAIEEKADAVLFGHTHRPELQYLNEDETMSKPLYLFGAGSIGLPYDGKCTYGILETYQNQMILMHATVPEFGW